jgi:signal transduction histidine kinase
MIAPFIRNEFLTVNAFDGIYEVKHKIISSGGAVVMMEDEPIGLINANDLLSKTHHLVVDCLSQKPELQRDMRIAEALKIMMDSRSDVLPVYEDKKLIGVLHKGDMTNHLVDSLEKHKQDLQAVVHDLKTPISNIMGIVGILEEMLEDPDHTEILSMAKTACTNAHTLVHELLRPPSHKQLAVQGDFFELRGLLEICANDFQVSLQKKNISLSVVLPEAEKYSYGHAIAVRRAIDNILNNAIKFTREYGKIELHSVIDGPYCKVSISDNGIGIPEKMKPLLFEKFTAAKREGTIGESTTGMGLHITMNICEQYGIELDFESEEGRGTNFHLRFRLTDHLS